jgi:ribonuclease R
MGKKHEHPRKPKKEKHKPRERGRGPEKDSQLSSTTTLEITGINEDGELIAKPNPWQERKQPPYILVNDLGGHAPSVGDRILAKLTRWDRNSFGAKVMRILPKAGPQRLIGVFKKQKGFALLTPVSRKDKWEYQIDAAHWKEAQNGDLVEASALPPRHTSGRGWQHATIEKVIGTIHSPKTSSLVALAQHGIPNQFSDEAMDQAKEAMLQPIIAKDRDDIRTIPLVTIDGEDARDFDDAVWAEADTDPKNKGGWHLLVAIADVAHYVHPFDALDKEAFDRGNSAYFPDRVVPMLPEGLSNGVCSLKPNEDRYCLAVHLWINAEGKTIRYQFLRGLMRSHARLTYTQVQDAWNSKEETLKPILEPLYGAFKSLASHREERGTLDLDLPEYKITLGEDGHVASIGKRERLDSHKLVEEFMIAANVAAADAILQNGLKGLFRVHEPPPSDRVEELREFLEKLGFTLSKGDGVQPRHFNKLLHKSADTSHAPLVHTSILRTQTQAYYSPKNLGHFGLALTHYSHFTSPIRRYSDLLVHRALINLLHLKEQRRDGMNKEQAAQLGTMAEHISFTERRAMLAERDATERYMVHYMADHIGWTGEGTITGINQFGLFVTLPATGATGFVPIGTLSQDFFRYIEKEKSFVGTRTRTRIQLGQKVVVRLREANTITGSLRFEMLSSDVSETTTTTPIRGDEPRREFRQRQGKQKQKNSDKKRKKDHKKHKNRD